MTVFFIFFFFQAEDGIRDLTVTGVQTCALPICVLRRLGRDVESAHRAAQSREIPRDPAFSAAVLQDALAMQIPQAVAHLRVDILRWPGGIVPRIQVGTAVLGIVELRLALQASLE